MSRMTAYLTSFGLVCLFVFWWTGWDIAVLTGEGRQTLGHISFGMGFALFVHWIGEKVNGG